jgi:hypothetical protein
MKPIARLREAHEVMSRFLSDGTIDHEGAHYAYSGLFTATAVHSVSVSRSCS